MNNDYYTIKKDLIIIKNTVIQSDWNTVKYMIKNLNNDDFLEFNNAVSRINDILMSSNDTYNLIERMYKHYNNNDNTNIKGGFTDITKSLKNKANEAKAMIEKKASEALKQATDVGNAIGNEAVKQANIVKTELVNQANAVKNEAVNQANIVKNEAVNQAIGTINNVSTNLNKNINNTSTNALMAMKVLSKGT